MVIQVLVSRAVGSIKPTRRLIPSSTRLVLTRRNAHVPFFAARFVGSPRP